MNLIGRSTEHLAIALLASKNEPVSDWRKSGASQEEEQTQWNMPGAGHRSSQSGQLVGLWDAEKFAGKTVGKLPEASVEIMDLPYLRVGCFVSKPLRLGVGWGGRMSCFSKSGSYCIQQHHNWIKHRVKRSQRE